MSRRSNRRYSVELKLQAVQDHICGEGSHHVKFIDHLAEVCGGESAFPICVEQDVLGYPHSRTAPRKVSMERKRSMPHTKLGVF